LDLGFGIAADDLSALFHFGFWVLDFGLQGVEVADTTASRPQSKIQNLKSKMAAVIQFSETETL
jgi:hypothetical protein